MFVAPVWLHPIPSINAINNAPITSIEGGISSMKYGASDVFEVAIADWLLWSSRSGKSQVLAKKVPNPLKIVKKYASPKVINSILPPCLPISAIPEATNPNINKGMKNERKLLNSLLNVMAILISQSGIMYPQQIPATMAMNTYNNKLNFLDFIILK